MFVLLIQIRERRQSAQFYFVELVIVNDNTQYVHYGRSLSQTVQRSLEIANMMDNVSNSESIAVNLL